MSSVHLNTVLLVRREAALAVMDAAPYVGQESWGHMAWHAFEPYMQGGDLAAWIYEIEHVLMPRLSAADGWQPVVQALLLLLRTLRLFNPTPRYGCERCT